MLARGKGWYVQETRRGKWEMLGMQVGVQLVLRDEMGKWECKWGGQLEITCWPSSGVCCWCFICVGCQLEKRPIVRMADLALMW